MPNILRYPRIDLRSKNELAKRIADRSLPYRDALLLINKVLSNFDRYWFDNAMESKPEKLKFVRSASGTPLGILLKLVDKKILAPYDELIPDFIYGGLLGRNHIQASKSLLGSQRGRSLLSLDLERFFEHVYEADVIRALKKCRCTEKAATLIAHLCCVFSGPKNSSGSEKILARGFATSTRLSIWSNLDTFQRIKWKAERLLKGHDPRVAVFIDDIGISASRVSEEVMKVVEKKLVKILQDRILPVNSSKTKIRTFAQGADHLGLRLGRTKVTMGGKSRAKRDRVLNSLKRPLSKEEKKRFINRKRSYQLYQKQISQINKK